MNEQSSWRYRCLNSWQAILIGILQTNQLESVAESPSVSEKSSKESTLAQVHRLSGLVVTRAVTLRSGALTLIPGEPLLDALRDTSLKGEEVIGECLPILHSAVGKLAILTRALDRLRDELVDCDDSEWVSFQVEFCFDGNVEPISGEKNVPAKLFLKEASDAYEERFSNDLVDYKKTATAIGKASPLTAEEIGRILEGLILSIREFDRDIGIHLAVIGEWLKRCEECEDSHSTVGEVFRKEMPPVTGDGRTQESAWFFPWARMQGEGIAMAHELMASKGPDYRLRMQALVEMDEEKVVEYWDTDAGRYWFRYRKDPRLGLIGE